MTSQDTRAVWSQSTGHFLLRPQDLLGSGGEGEVYRLQNHLGLVAKIYRRDKLNADTINKLEVMIAYPPNTEDEQTGRLFVSWPKDTVHDTENGPVIGFLMPIVNKTNGLFDYYNPSLRRRNAPHVNYANLCSVAKNLAIALDRLHGLDYTYIIGDINESNAYITGNENVTLIDADSFQVTDRRVTDKRTTQPTIYRCLVGKPEYTPPELQGVNFGEIDRDVYHDNFALAVVIYQLLMEGTHPFRGKYTGVRSGSSEPPKVEANIEQGNFLYSRRRAVSLNPMPKSLPWESLPENIRDLFAKCFDEGFRHRERRPQPREWIDALDEAMRTLKQCARNPNHWYFDKQVSTVGNAPCTWCERRANFGIESFPDHPDAQIVTSPTPPPLPMPPRPAPPSTGGASVSTGGRGLKRWLVLVGAIVAVGVFIPIADSVGTLITERQVQSLWPWVPEPTVAPVVPPPVIPPTHTPVPTSASLPVAVPTLTPLPPNTPLPAAVVPTITPTPTRDPLLELLGTLPRGYTPIPTRTLIPTRTPTPRPLPTPIPTVNQDGYVLIRESGGPEEVSLDWDFAAYGSGIPTVTNDGSVNLSFSPVSHSADTAFITVEAKDDSRVGNGIAMIQITNELRNIVYLLVVEVQDAGEPTPTPTAIPHIRESGDVLVAEGGFTNFVFSWNRGVHGDGKPSVTDGGPVNIWYSDIDHQDQQATITVGANDDSLVGNGHAEITISNQTGSMVYVLSVEVVDAGEATATPTSTPVPTFTPTPTSTPTPLVTPTPTTIPLPNLSLEAFRICVEGMACWPQTPNEDSVSGSLRVSITWRVENIGSGPTESRTDLRFYADGEYHEEEYLRYAFDIPILEPGESIGQRNQTLETPDSRWPLDFSLTGANTIIAIVDMQDRVQEIGDDCRNLKVYRDRSSARNSTCDNVRYVDSLPFLPTPTPTPLFSPTPTPTTSPTPAPTPTPVPTQSPMPTRTPTPIGASATSVGVTVTISWDMFDANEPNNAIYNVGLCNPSDCSREWLRDRSGTEVFLTWRSDDGQMQIPVPPGSYMAKAEVFTGNRTFRCTTDFEVTSSLNVVTTREDCNIAQYGQELKVR